MNYCKYKKAQELVTRVERTYKDFMLAAQEAMDALESISGVFAASGDRRVRIIVGVVATEYDRTPEAILGAARGAPRTCEARHAGMVLCRDLLRMSSSEIAVQFRRDHGAVLYAFKNVANWLEVDPSFSARWTLLKDACRHAVSPAVSDGRAA